MRSINLLGPRFRLTSLGLYIIAGTFVVLNKLFLALNVMALNLCELENVVTSLVVLSCVLAVRLGHVDSLSK